MSGKLIGIARATELGAPLEKLDATQVSVEAGVEGDARGRKARRQVTVLFRDGWEDACADLGNNLDWTTRRANLYLDGVVRPQAEGGRITIGDVVLEIVMETDPCHLMDRAQEGLRKALTPDWRAGVCCNVLAGGRIAIGDTASIAAA